MPAMKSERQRNASETAATGVRASRALARAHYRGAGTPSGTWRNGGADAPPKFLQNNSVASGRGYPPPHFSTNKPNNSVSRPSPAVPFPLREGGAKGCPLPIFRRFEWELLRCLPSAPRRWGKGHPFLPNKTNNSGQGRPMNHIEGGFRHDVAMPRDHTRPFCISRRNRISPAQWRGRRGNPDDGSGGC